MYLRKVRRKSYRRKVRKAYRRDRWKRKRRTVETPRWNNGVGTPHRPLRGPRRNGLGEVDGSVRTYTGLVSENLTRRLEPEGDGCRKFSSLVHRVEKKK